MSTERNAILNAKLQSAIRAQDWVAIYEVFMEVLNRPQVWRGIMHGRTEELVDYVHGFFEEFLGHGERRVLNERSETGYLATYFRFYLIDKMNKQAKAPQPDDEAVQIAAAPSADEDLRSWASSRLDRMLATARELLQGEPECARYVAMSEEGVLRLPEIARAFGMSEDTLMRRRRAWGWDVTVPADSFAQTVFGRYVKAFVPDLQAAGDAEAISLAEVFAAVALSLQEPESTADQT